MDDRVRDVFVIMPFSGTPTRNKADLTAFFENNLKEPIETHTGFKYRYRVSRSDDSFDIGKKIVRDIYSADIVLCDLSGEHANPNVMYELGLRLALTNKPVIMFREQHPSNKNIFDISIYHTKEYAVTRYKELEAYVILKMEKFENGDEVFASPVLEILAKEPSVIVELQLRSVTAQLVAIKQSLDGLKRATGGALHRFLASQGSSLVVPDDVKELLEFVQDNSEELKPLPWKHCVFRPYVPPALSAYLSSLPLNNVVEEWISKLWNTILFEYYSQFFGTDLFWTEVDLLTLHNFTGETDIIRRALVDLVLFLARETKEEKAKELNDMLNNLSESFDFKDLVESLRANI